MEGAKIFWAGTPHSLVKSTRKSPGMHIGLTYDLRAEYLVAGYTAEETAEFDRPDTIEAIEAALEFLGHRTDRIGNVGQLVQRQTFVAEKDHSVARNRNNQRAVRNPRNERGYGQIDLNAGPQNEVFVQHDEHQEKKQHRKERQRYPQAMIRPDRGLKTAAEKSPLRRTRAGAEVFHDPRSPPVPPRLKNARISAAARSGSGRRSSAALPAGSVTP